MEIFWVILFISFPIFYVYGIVSFIRDLTNKRNRSVSSASRVAHSTLEVPVPSADYLQDAKAPHVQQELAVQHIKDASGGWYSENSISLLLYIGAFLIVASAAAFVGLAWETIGGIGKALVVTLVCLGFYVAGIAALTNPRIKQAAYTFLGVGTLLIPFVSWGWYGFVLRSAGVSGGLVWFISSLLTMSVSIILAQYVQQRWYAYMSSLAVLSGVLSTVYMAGLPDTFYVISSVLSAFLYFGASVYAHLAGGKTDALFAVPYRVSAQILMPLSLVYGIFVAIDRGLLFSFDAVLIGALGTLYYLLTYVAVKVAGYFTVAQSLLLLTLLFFSRWIGIAAEGSYTLLLVCGAAYVVQAPAFTKGGMRLEGLYSSQLGLVTVLLVWLLSILLAYSLGYHLFYTTVLVTLACYSGWLERQWNYGFLIGAVMAYTIQYFVHEVWPLSDIELWNGCVYVLIGALLWTWGIFEEQKRQSVQTAPTKITVVLSIAALYYVLGTVWLIARENTVWVVFWLGALLFMLHAYVKQYATLVYAGIVMLFVGILPLLSALNVARETYSFIFSGVAFGLYTMMMVVRGTLFASPLRSSALLVQAVVPFVFNSTSHALTTVYAAVVLFAIDAFIRRDERSGYAASA